jgi:glycine cleavage system H protein
MRQTSDLLYTSEHEWISIDDTVATIGITNFAQSELGDIIFIELPNVGDEFESNDVFGTIEAVKTVADLYMPLSGKIIEINPNIEDAPENVNNSPYDDGWIVKIDISANADKSELLNEESYKKLING